MASVDPNMSGYVKFDSFLEYLTRQATDTDSADSLIESFRVLAQDRVRNTNFCTYSGVPIKYLHTNGRYNLKAMCMQVCKIRAISVHERSSG